MKHELTENEIYVAISALEEKGENGNLTPSEAARLTQLRMDLRQIHCARWPNAFHA